MYCAKCKIKIVKILYIAHKAVFKEESRMRTKLKRGLSLLLSVTMICSGIHFTQKVNAVEGTSASMSTEMIDDSIEETKNANVYFVQSATKKIITLDGIDNNPIDCSNVYDKNNIPQNGLFTVYYGQWNDLSVVNFTNNATNTSWKADNDKVFQMGKRTNPSGWESVQMKAQGDGTISFKSSANNAYFTVEENKLALSKLKDGDEISPNEKFILYTDTQPKTAKKVRISNVAGDSVTVSWEGVSECLYCGYEVLYATSEHGRYVSAGQTAETKMDITGLDLNTRYYFKVRTMTNNEGGVYADSKIAYATTLKEYKPSKPLNVNVVEKNSDLVISWDKVKNAKRFKVYRAVSRFGEYKEIGETSATTFTDKNRNQSRYGNYYKIKAFNDSDVGEFSEAGSLEISMFGLNTYIFNDTDDMKKVNEVTQKIYENQHYNQFGQERYALAYKPGNYTDAGIVNVGYYTQILGLGKTPYDVRLNNVHTPAALSGNNTTCNFWVGIENVTIADVEQNDSDAWFCFQWGVSQASPARRLNVERKTHLQWLWEGWCSGGYIADSYFAKPAGSFSQQQYYYRNCNFNGGTYGVNWNQVIQGSEGVTAQNSSDNSNKPLAEAVSLKSNNGVTNWNNRGCTTIIGKTPEIREKPFLYFDTEQEKYKVFIPAERKNTSGVSWSQENMGEGTSISVDKYFYIANPEKDTAKTINEQLEKGKNIIFRPGVYHVSEPIQVKKANTVLLGIGEATIIPENNIAAIKTSDVGGIAICGLILDAGNYSKTLLTVGDEGCNKNHEDNPTVLSDVIYRVGGTGHLGRSDSCQVINSNHVIIDHTWIWRADHGDNTGWNANVAKNGLVVNGDNVTAYGLFVEHFKEYDILWRGEQGKTYFLQNEKCYDPQSQKGWMSHDGQKKGFAAYKVTNNVREHYAVGLGIYDVFINTNGASIYLDSAVEVPNKENVLIENVCIVEIASGSGPKVGINHIINGTTAGIRTGAENNGGYAIQRLLSYNNGNSISLPDYYVSKDSVEPQIQQGKEPTRDNLAEKDIKKEAFSKDSETPLWQMTEKDFDKKIEGCENGEAPTVKPDDKKKDDNIHNSITLKSGQKITVGKYTYRITKVSGKKGTVTLVKVSKKKYARKLKSTTVKTTIKYNGYRFKVTVVGKKAFKNCRRLKKVIIGKNARKINSKAFYQSRKLKQIIIKGTKLVKVSKNAFHKKVRKVVKIKAKRKVKKRLLKVFKRKR